MHLPQDFMTRMQELMGSEYESFIKTYDREPFKALRVNTLKLSPEEFKEISPLHLSPVPWCETGFYYGESALRAESKAEELPEERPGKHPYHEMGLYYMQEPSAMSVAELAGVTPGEKVLDLCAAPGGKSTQLAAKLQGEGLLVSNEIHPARCKILSQNIERMGITNSVVTNETPQGLSARFVNFFDCIVVDAPCSGEGMFRKDEEAVNQWSLENVIMCADRQDEILDEAVKMLCSGGRIVYSTCTFAPAEDEDCIRRFLERHPDFYVEKGCGFDGFAQGKPEWCGGLKEVDKTYRLWPHHINGEGHFAALLVHKGEKTEAAEPVNKKKKDGTVLDKEKLRLYEDFIRETLVKEPAGEKILFGESLYLMPMELNLKGIKVLRPGLHVGTFEKKRFEPSHSLALALKMQDVKQVLEADVEAGEPEKYLRGESLVTEGVKGWTLVCAQGHPMGWGKVSNGMLKNHYPKGLRR